MAETAGIVIIGDEILSGKFADENAAFLITELRALGVQLCRIAVIPDRLPDIAQTVAAFSSSFDHVFTSGGVGPTHDDITMAGIAQGFGVQVELHPELEAKVRAHWGDGLHQANLRLAEIPAGSELVGDDERWPVARCGNVFILPGVPSLFRRKFRSIVGLLAVAEFSERRIYCLGEEGEITPHLHAVDQAYGDVKLGSYPRFDEVAYKVLITLEGADQDQVQAADAQLRALLGELVTEPPADS